MKEAVPSSCATLLVKSRSPHQLCVTVRGCCLRSLFLARCLGINLRMRSSPRGTQPSSVQIPLEFPMTTAWWGWACRSARLRAVHPASHSTLRAALHYTALHYTALHYTLCCTLHLALHLALHLTLHYTALHLTLCRIVLHYTLHYTLHCTAPLAALHNALHYTTLPCLLASECLLYLFSACASTAPCLLAELCVFRCHRMAS